MPKTTKLTILAVGDGDSKKTELLIKYTYNEIRYRKFMPTIFVNNVQEIVVDHKLYSIYFRDADVDDDYVILRHAAYETADCVLVCYRIGNRRTFDNITKKWCVEIRKIAPEVPIILVATDSETRNNRKNKNFVTLEEAENLQYITGAGALIECSVENNFGIDDVFIEAVRSIRRICKIR